MKPGSESRSSVRFRRVFRLSTRNEFGGLLRRGTNSISLTLLDDLLLSSSHWPLNRVTGAATYPERSILPSPTPIPVVRSSMCSMPVWHTRLYRPHVYADRSSAWSRGFWLSDSSPLLCKLHRKMPLDQLKCWGFSNWKTFCFPASFNFAL